MPEVERTLQHAMAERKDVDKRFGKPPVGSARGADVSHRRGVDAGLKLLARTVERTQNDFFYHSWGGGAYFMELWGIEALHGNRFDVAEEAFLEALAHDPGSEYAGLPGMQVLCERQGRVEEAKTLRRAGAQVLEPGRTPKRL